MGVVRRRRCAGSPTYTRVCGVSAAKGAERKNGPRLREAQGLGVEYKNWDSYEAQTPAESYATWMSTPPLQTTRIHDPL